MSMKHQKMETSINILTTLAQRVGEVGIASACRRHALVRAALVAQASVIWQGTGRVDFRSRSCAIKKQVVAFHASV